MSGNEKSSNCSRFSHSRSECVQRQLLHLPVDLPPRAAARQVVFDEVDHVNAYKRHNIEQRYPARVTPRT